MLSSSINVVVDVCTVYIQYIRILNNFGEVDNYSIKLLVVVFIPISLSPYFAMAQYEVWSMNETMNTEYILDTHVWRTFTIFNKRTDWMCFLFLIHILYLNCVHWKGIVANNNSIYSFERQKDGGLNLKGYSLNGVK